MLLKIRLIYNRIKSIANFKRNYSADLCYSNLTVLLVREYFRLQGVLDINVNLIKVLNSTVTIHFHITYLL